MKEKTIPGAAEAWRMAEAEKKGSLRQPTDADSPPPGTLPGRKPALLHGQVDIFGRVYEDPSRRLEDDDDDAA